MASNTETATSKVLLDGKQAEDELKQLKTLAEQTRKEYEKLKLSKDPEAAKKLKEAVELEKQVKRNERSFFSLDRVLKNLNGSTIKDLQKAQRQLNAEIRNHTRETNEDKEAVRQLQKQYSLVGAEIDSVKSSMRKMDDVNGKSNISFRSIASSIGGFVAGLGLTTSAMEIFKGVISSSEVISDQWAKTTAGLSSGWNIFLNSLANWNWDRFIERMQSAVKAGREYAEIVDLLEDRSRGLSSRHKQEDETIAKLRVSYYDSNKTATEKAAIMQEVIDLTTRQIEEDKVYANQNYDKYTEFLTQSKGIKKETLEQFILFKGTTEEKVQLVEDLDNATNFYNANVAALGKENPAIKRAWRTMIELRVKGVGAYSQLLNAINPEEINKATQLYDAVSDANKAVFENTEGLYRKMAMQENKIEQQLNKQVNATIEIKDAFQDLSKQITDFDSQINSAIAAGNTPLAEKLSMEKKSAELLLETYKKVKYEIEQGWDIDQRDQGFIDKLTSIGADLVKSNNPSANPLSLRKFDNNLSGPSQDIQIDEEEAKQKIAEIKDASFELASELNSAIFSMVTNHQQAEFNEKMRLLELQKEKELSNINLTAKEKDEITKKYEARSRALKAEQFEKEKKAATLMAIINGAVAVTKTFATFGWPAGIIPAAVQAASTIAQIAIIQSQPVPEFAKGRYNVTGAQTGKQYTNVGYTGQAVTGLYTRPALVAETGAEMIIDPYTTRNIMMNFPGIIDAINSAKVNQYSDGRHVKQSDKSSNAGNNMYAEHLSVLKDLHYLIKKIDNEGIKSTSIISLFDLEKKQSQKAKIQSDTEM